MPVNEENDLVGFDDASQSGIRLTVQARPALGVAPDEGTLALLEEITALLQSNEPDEGALLHEFVGMLTDVGLTCARRPTHVDGARAIRCRDARGATGRAHRSTSRACAARESGGMVLA